MTLTRFVSDGIEPGADELAQMEEGYQAYAKLADMYERIIATEDDPEREALLQGCAASLHEDNK